MARVTVLTFSQPEYTCLVSQIDASDLSNSNLPMPAHYMQMYGRFWDVVSIIIFSFAAIATLAAHADALTWREYACLLYTSR